VLLIFDYLPLINGSSLLFDSKPCDYGNTSEMLINVRRSCGGLVVSVPSYEATDQDSIFGEAFFPGSGVADSKRSESGGGCSSTIKMPAVKSS